MKTNKGGITETAEASTECCMCGDHGLSCELFKCKVCQFRSQHRYCSNLYPKGESYRICNWCLSQKEDAAEKAQNSCNSSSSSKIASEGDIKPKMKSGSSDNHGSPRKDKKGSLKLQVFNNPMEKHSSPERSPASATRKRVMIGSGMEDRLKRTKSEEIISNGNAIKKYVFRNRVRRYKLLEEVSSQ